MCLSPFGFSIRLLYRLHIKKNTNQDFYMINTDSEFEKMNVSFKNIGDVIL